MTAGLRLVPPPIQITDAPFPDWSHLIRLSDDTGLLEHARNAIARREHGYCVDDVARGLMVASREPQPTGQVVGLAERYLAFLTHAQGPDGAGVVPPSMTTPAPTPARIAARRNKENTTKNSRSGTLARPMRSQ